MMCYYLNVHFQDQRVNYLMSTNCHNKWASVSQAWTVLRLRVEEWPPDMEGRCEYIE